MSSVEQLSSELRHLEMLQNPTAIQVKRYEEILRQLSKEDVSILPPKPVDPRPEGLDPMEAALRKTIKQIGVPHTYKPHTDSMSTAQEIFSETIEWHKAAIDVFEYMSAQMALDLFKTNPKAKQIWERIIISGYQQLHSEAGNYSR